MEYTTLISNKTSNRISSYLEELRRGKQPGRYLQDQLRASDLSSLNRDQLLALLIRTKRPRIYAESEVSGDGSDWNLTELTILGDISVAVPVTIYDNGHHSAPEICGQPWQGTLLFTPGALLRNGRGCTPADWPELVRGDRLSSNRYFGLYERRLLPVLCYASEMAGRKNSQAFITVPGLGCGQFAGPFRGRLGGELRDALYLILEKHGRSLPNIQAVYYDPYDECDNQRYEIAHISFLVRPLTRGNEKKTQLCPPEMYEEEGDCFKDCEFFSVVAWDHVSWPGNDFYVGSRATDDGVKAAATDSMAVMTGMKGSYDSHIHKYLPPQGYRTWLDLVTRKPIRLDLENKFNTCP